MSKRRPAGLEGFNLGKVFFLCPRLGHDAGGI